MKGKVGSIVALLAILMLVFTSAPLANTEGVMAAPDSNGWQIIPTPGGNVILDDVMPLPDGKTLFLSTTDSSSNTSTLWRSPVPATAGSWTAVSTATTPGWIIRLNPGWADAPSIYWCDRGGTEIRYSFDSGSTFASRTAPASITDLTVEESKTLYLASAGNVYKSTSGGHVWGVPVNAGISTISMLAMAPTYPDPPVGGNILAGGTGGAVSFSTDGGATFTPFPPLPVGGNVQIAGDKNYASNNTVYAGSSNGRVYRWVIGPSTTWELINPTIAKVSGLAVDYNGLSAADATPASGADRTINPTASPPAWTDLISGLTGGETFAQVPSALRCSAGVLFAIDTTNNDLYEYTGIEEGLVPTFPWGLLAGVLVPSVLIGAALGIWLWRRPKRISVPETIRLPDSGVTIKFSKQYSHDKLTELTRRLLTDAELAARFRADPVPKLRETGIIVTSEALNKITDEDLLAAFGHRKSDAC